jgi:hypothetical protein
LKEINLNDADAGSFGFTSNLGCVLPGLKRGHKSCLAIVARLQAGSFHFGLLAGSIRSDFPIVILDHERPVLVS